MKNFSGKVAAITGAASGMGRQLAIRLAERGCHVAISDVNAAELEITAERARAHGVRVSTRVLDVSDRAAMQAWADDTAAE
ncbi:SDR family NAD(P)-dependent oxidoreductase, partial [Escherichia coli]|nr:SDR family NAD(P)-dependent oxidoreductase [Escherichia coli]